MIFFSIPFYILPIHGADLALGVQWLQTLSAFLSDYTVPAIQFTHKGKPITLTGPTSHSPELATFSQFCRFVFTDAIDSLHSLSVTPLNDTTVSPQNDTCIISFESVPPSLCHLLQQYSSVFSLPQGLPPNRIQDHHVHLLTDSQPVNVRPYRYPQFQKEVITTMINDMLREGIIRPSTSPFSSPVLLVRKKDGTWCFCVDYCALNAITIKDRFPIPTVDELHGSQVYSKLDLQSGYHQILLNPADTFKTAFRTVDIGFLVVPFGLSNALATFQAAMNDVFREFLCKFVLVFFFMISLYIALIGILICLIYSRSYRC